MNDRTILAKSNKVEPSGDTLSQRLRAETREVHTLAEKTDLIRGFLRGLVDRERYALLLRDLFEIYSALETSLSDLSACPYNQAFFRPELFRVDTLRQDLTFFTGDAWREWPATNAAQRYRDHLGEVAEKRPQLLCAHLYSRYLGDLSGGQILSRVVTRSLRLTPPQGVAFYGFPEISDIAAYKEDFRASLNAVGERLGSAGCDEIVQEAIEAFRYNIAVFEEIEGNCWPAFARGLVPTLLSASFRRTA